MPIPLESAQQHHPVELTRQASPESALLQGDFTLLQLRANFGSPDMTEEAVLAAAGNLGHAFFKIGAVYRSFAPVKGETAILSPSQESGIAVEVQADAEVEESDVDLAESEEDETDMLSDPDDYEEDGDDMLEDPDDDGEDDDLNF